MKGRHKTSTEGGNSWNLWPKKNVNDFNNVTQYLVIEVLTFFILDFCWFSNNDRENDFHAVMQ